MSFIVATGIECSAPIIPGGVRRDQLLLTGHWDRVVEDLDLVAGMGITHLRYGIPFHVVAADPARLDWRWTDAAKAAIRERGIEPIVDLMHFAVPDDLVGVSDTRVEERYVVFVREFVERFPWVRWYTPVNEPFITALFSAQKGWWNEQLTGDRSFVAALANVVTCAIRGTEVIRERRPDAIFLQSDACEWFRPTVPEAASLADHLNERAMLGFDLTYGRAPSRSMQRWLIRNGLAPARLDWFMEHGSADGAIVGLDYYSMNERRVDAHGEESPDARRGFAALAKAYHERYGRPVMLAETNIVSELATSWLTELWTDIRSLVEAGVPVAGFCWYSLTDQVDWDTCLREPNGRINSLGLVDLDRVRRPVSFLYEELARASGALGAPAALPEDDLAAA